MKEKLNAQKKKLFDVFFDFFVAALAFFKDFFDTTTGNFNKENFIQDRHADLKHFFSLFAMTQMFERIVEERKVGGGCSFYSFSSSLSTLSSFPSCLTPSAT
jgi:hypothetical protein